MNNQEFDNYLALVSRLLKLNRQQQDQLTDELRDHLETRVQELVDEGLTPEEAKRRAIEDFGDAAALAREMNEIALAKRRVWTMRFTTFATAASFLVILFVFSIWPEDSKVGAPNKSNAVESVKEQPFAFANRDTPALTGDKSRTKQSPAPKFTNSETARENLLIRQNLQRKQDIEFVDVTIREAVAQLLADSNINYQFDKSAKDSDNQLGAVSFRSNDIETRIALRLILKKLNLAYTVQDSCLLIIGRNYSEDFEFLERRITNVAPLLQWLQTSGETASAGRRLEELIRSSIHPDSWNTTNGVSTVQVVGDLLISTASSEASDELNLFLDDLIVAIPRDTEPEPIAPPAN